METPLQQYIDTVNQIYSTGETTEHSFRGAFASLCEDILNKSSNNEEHYTVVNEPSRKEYGAPDYEIVKGDIVVGNDVWIGYEAVIFAGVTIGDGAIIGTRAVVTKDVSPYTIVGGVPAKLIRKRFSENVINTLLEIKWWDWSREKISEKIHAIQTGEINQLL